MYNGRSSLKTDILKEQDSQLLEGLLLVWEYIVSLAFRYPSTSINIMLVLLYLGSQVFRHVLWLQCFHYVRADHLLLWVPCVHHYQGNQVDQGLQCHQHFHLFPEDQADHLYQVHQCHHPCH